MPVRSRRHIASWGWQFFGVLVGAAAVVALMWWFGWL
jgi:hypothetical protein